MTDFQIDLMAIKEEEMTINIMEETTQEAIIIQIKAIETEMKKNPIIIEIIGTEIQEAMTIEIAEANILIQEKEGIKLCFYLHEK